MDKRKGIFTQCVIKPRNSLPVDEVMVARINIFKKGIRQIHGGEVWPLAMMTNGNHHIERQFAGPPGQLARHCVKQVWSSRVLMFFFYSIETQLAHFLFFNFKYLGLLF